MILVRRRSTPNLFKGDLMKWCNAPLWDIPVQKHSVEWKIHPFSLIMSGLQHFILTFLAKTTSDQENIDKPEMKL
jgi:hypothetical protein